MAQRSPSSGIEEHVKRQAGVAGIRYRSMMPCPVCEELNLPVTDTELRANAQCHRCEELLYPQPPDASPVESKEPELPVSKIKPAAPEESPDDYRAQLIVALFALIILVVLVGAVVVASN